MFLTQYSSVYGPSNGYPPTNNLYTNTANENLSELWSGLAPKTTSGAIYPLVPLIVNLSAYPILSLSIILIAPVLGLKKIFPSLTSL